MGFFQNGELCYQTLTISTSGAAYVMTATSKQVLVFTGGTAQTLQLPPTTNMSPGQFYEIFNNSSQTMTIEYNSTASFGPSPTLAAGVSLLVTLISLVGMPTASDGTWTVLNAAVGGVAAVAAGGTGTKTLTAHDIIVGNGTSAVTQVSPSTAGKILTSNGVSADPSFQTISGNTAILKAPTVQKFTISGSGTYTTPTSPSPLYIEIEMVGGGGGGSGSGTGVSTAGVNGNDSTFKVTAGPTLLVANGGGGGGQSGQYSAGGGGGASLGSGPVGNALFGGAGAGGSAENSTFTGSGGQGGNNPFGGGGSSGVGGGVAGSAGAANTGAGGGGAGAGETDVFGGGGGGAAGYVKAIIGAPSATYAYVVGSGGAGGAAGGGTNPQPGGAGATGQIIVREYYQ